MASPLAAPRRCEHCRAGIPESAGEARYCCAGCEAVAALLRDEGLERYYELAGGALSPAVAAGAQVPASHTWLEPILEAAQAGRPSSQAATAAAAAGARAGGDGASLVPIDLDVQGLHCAACVWLLQETFRRQAGTRPGAGEIIVNPAVGRVRLRLDPARFDVRRWVRGVERFGYRFGPPRKEASARSRELPLRLGVAAALTMNGMLFSVSFYFGLSPADPEVFRLFTALAAALSTAVVVVGGWPFLRSAWQSLRSGWLHLDLPIALGIVLVYGVSLAQQAANPRGDLSYFDTLNVFITLMLLGRFLQERVLERNRKRLLEDDGAEAIAVRRIEPGDRLVTVRAPQVRRGDRLLIAPGDLVPVDGRLLDEEGWVRLDWVSGESDPVPLAAGERVPAGAFHVGRRAFRVEAATDFGASPLEQLLRAPRPAADRPGGHRRLWDRVARVWVVGVLGLAGAGFLAWLPQGLDRALGVAVAMLVVTCPCATGIAVPLAYELVHARLRRRGLFVRRDDVFDRLARVRRVVFDKTGTLTLQRVELADPGALEALGPGERAVLHDLAARSQHPASRAIAEALARDGEPRLTPGARVEETPGGGVEWRREDGLWRLGRPAWAAFAESGAAALSGAVLARDGATVAHLATREVLRPDARQEIDRLLALGLELRILSGDAPAKVRAVAERLGIPPRQAEGDLDPRAKAARVAALDREDTLYLGDGVNDALAFDAALVAGTPSIDRPVVPGRSDFFLLGEGLGSIEAALRAARRLRRVVYRLLALAVVYNLGAIAWSLAGWMTPLAAAIAMPASTLTVLAVTVASLGGRRGAPRAAPLAPARLLHAEAGA